MNGPICNAVPYTAVAYYNISFLCALDELKTRLPPLHRPSKSSLTHAARLSEWRKPLRGLYGHGVHAVVGKHVKKRIRTSSIRIFTALACLPGGCDVWQHLRVLYFCLGAQRLTVRM